MMLRQRKSSQQRCACKGRSGVRGASWIALRFQAADINEQGLHVFRGQPFAECRHLSRRAGRDAAKDEVVVALRAHQLRTTARLASAALMTPAAAIADEQGLSACDLRRWVGGGPLR